MNRKISHLDRNANLNDFIRTDIQARSDFVQEARAVIDSVVRALQSPLFDYDVDEVFKTGSLGQGIALNNNLSDIDLVVYLNDFSIENIIRNMEQILTDMYRSLERTEFEYKLVKKNEFLITVKHKTRRGRTIVIDILPGINDDPNTLYRKMLETKNRQTRKHYSVSFARQQRDFIKRRETELKKLFQLTKYWAKADLISCKFPSYPLSLIVIYTWEKYDQPKDFDPQIGFKAVLKTLTEYTKIKHVWSKFYGRDTWKRFRDENTSEQNRRPYLYDPANPINNVLEDLDWDEIVNAAQITLRSPILRNVIISENWK